jgi:hypothetical protein
MWHPTAELGNIRLSGRSPIPAAGLLDAAEAPTNALSYLAGTGPLRWCVE